MGRELRRKQAKKDGKKSEVVKNEDNNVIKKYIINVLCITAIIVTIYIISGLFVTKELNWFGNNKKDNETKSNVSNTILASDIFRQSDETYYVYFYNFDELEKESKITNFVNTIYDTKVYKVNTNSALNANYVGESSNKEATSLEELKVVTPTLIKIQNNKIIEYYEGNEIVDKLN